MIDIENRIIKYDESEGGEAVLEQAAKIVQIGGVIAFPTDTVYGLGGSVFDTEAANKIFSIKRRSKNKPLIVCISDVEELGNLAAEVSDLAGKLAEHFWPGPLTLVLKKSADVPDIVTGGRDTIAVRCPANEMLRKLIKKCGTPLVATSANLSGHPSARSAQEVYDQLDDQIDMIIDGGRSALLPESTVLDMSAGSLAILREGAIPRHEISAVVHELTR